MAGRYADEEYARRKAAAAEADAGETPDERGDGADEKTDWAAVVLAVAEIARYAGPPMLAFARGLFARRLCPTCGASPDDVIDGEGHVR